MPVTVLVVDDEPHAAALIATVLGMEGFDTHISHSGQEALDRLAERHVDVAVLDVEMPGIDGLTVARQVRAAEASTAILLVSAQDAVSSVVAGFDAGADDYLLKPFAPEELAARVRALARRASRTLTAGAVKVGDLVLDEGRRQVWRGDREIQLSRREFDLLLVLVSNRDQVVARAELFERAWGYSLEHASNTLDVYVGYLRRKLEADGGPRLIETVRGVGYVVRSRTTRT